MSVRIYMFMLVCVHLPMYLCVDFVSMWERTSKYVLVCAQVCLHTDAGACTYLRNHLTHMRAAYIHVCVQVVCKTVHIHTYTYMYMYSYTWHEQVTCRLMCT